MWCKTISLIALFAVALTEITVPGIDRSIGNGQRSVGFKMVYGDEDFTLMNEVVSDMEKDPIKSRINLNEALPPLPAEDVKCLMSVDRYCSKEMREMKSVLIQALKEDCKQCTSVQKEKAGKIVASMLAHDPVAWKLFLTRYDSLQRVQRILG